MEKNYNSSSVIIFKWDNKSSSFFKFSPCQLLTECHQQDEGLITPLISLKDFNDKSISHLPIKCTHFVFLNGNLGNNEAQRFFLLHGDKVTTLELVEIWPEDTWGMTPIKTLKNILMNLTPHLENLALGGYAYENEIDSGIFDSESSTPTPFNLPFLKSFSWHADLYYYDSEAPRRLENAKIVREILNASPALELIEDFHFDLDFKIVLQLGKVSLIKQLTIDDTVDLGHLMTFIKSARLQITHLELIHDIDSHLVDPDLKKFSTTITQLLRSTCHSLKVLDLSQFFSCVDIQFPALYALEKLTIGSVDGHKYSTKRCFPAPMHLAETFPDLQILDCCKLQCQENSYWTVYFPHEGSGGSPPAPNLNLWGWGRSQNCYLRHVTTIILSDHCTVQWMENLKEICPHFTKAILYTDENSNDSLGARIPMEMDSLNEDDEDNKMSQVELTLSRIWRHWPHLESLEIRIHDLLVNSQICLDAAFTGLTREECDKLREEEEMELSGKFEKGGLQGISNLENLKSLKIKLEHACLGKLALQSLEEAIILTHVSALTSFRHMKGLNVEVQFDRQNCQWGKALEKKFEHLYPYVTVKNIEADHVSC